MLHLLQLEWQKFKNYKTFRVMAIIYLVILPAFLFTIKAFVLPSELTATQTSVFKFPTIWAYLGYIGSWLSFFCLGFISILMVTSEYANRTLRQNIISGLSRKEFFLSKVYFIIAVSVVATLYFALIGFLVGLMHTNNLENKIFLELGRIPMYFLMCIGYMVLGFFLGTIIRRSGVALFLYLIYVIFLEAALRWAVHYKLFAHKSMHFYPINAIEDLAPMPFSEMADNFTQESGFGLFLTPMEATITTIVYSSIFLYLTYRYLQRASL